MEHCIPPFRCVPRTLCSSKLCLVAKAIVTKQIIQRLWCADHKAKKLLAKEKSHFVLINTAAGRLYIQSVFKFFLHASLCSLKGCWASHTVPPMLVFKIYPGETNSVLWLNGRGMDCGVGLGSGSICRRGQVEPRNYIWLLLISEEERVGLLCPYPIRPKVSTFPTSS